MYNARFEGELKVFREIIRHRGIYVLRRKRRRGVYVALLYSTAPIYIFSAHTRTESIHAYALRLRTLQS
jgi:hypothetical protein